jgi:hypothetical protein
MRRLVFLSLAVMLSFSILGTANAALQNNGNGLIYDTDLDITWYDASVTGRSWQEAKTWAENLEITVNGATYSNWRLPSALNRNGSGPTDGYNVTGSEMGHLFYTELVNKGYYDVNGNVQPGYGLVNKAPFTTLEGLGYWSNEAGSDPSYNGGAWYFAFSFGRQSVIYTDYLYQPLAVHEGNVGAPVPIPAAIWLLGSGLIGLVSLRRRMKK